eukprot:5104523-Alexandrium_andersonii.AAC.1
MLCRWKHFEAVFALGRGPFGGPLNSSCCGGAPRAIPAANRGRGGRQRPRCSWALSDLRRCAAGCC